MNMKIGVIKGDGIGPEIVDEALKVLDRIAEVYGHSFSYTQLLMGGASIDVNGVPLTDETLEAAKASDAVLMGSIGGDAKSTKEENGVLVARDELTYSEEEIRRIAKRGFDIAMKRRKKVTSVDKANVLDSSRLWRKVVEEVSEDYPEVQLENMLVDNCAMQLVKDPAQFDVILTENMFGDILSDEASMVTGSIGMLASASLVCTGYCRQRNCESDRYDSFGSYDAEILL